MSRAEPAYYDSQAAAAAALSIDIYDIRQAKQEGCTAFRSGRVYRAPLLSWFERRRRPAGARLSPPGDDGPEKVNLQWVHWDDRRAVLLELLYEFLEMNRQRGHITDAVSQHRIGVSPPGPATRTNMERRHR